MDLSKIISLKTTGKTTLEKLPIVLDKFSKRRSMRVFCMHLFPMLYNTGVFPLIGFIKTKTLIDQILRCSTFHEHLTIFLPKFTKCNLFSSHALNE